MTRNEWGDYVDDDHDTISEVDDQRRYRLLVTRWDRGVVLSPVDRNGTNGPVHSGTIGRTATAARRPR